MTIALDECRGDRDYEWDVAIAFARSLFVRKACNLMIFYGAGAIALLRPKSDRVFITIIHNPDCGAIVVNDRRSSTE